MINAYYIAKLCFQIGKDVIAMYDIYATKHMSSYFYDELKGQIGHVVQGLDKLYTQIYCQNQTKI